jgi:hypothetical protein
MMMDCCYKDRIVEVIKDKFVDKKYIIKITNEEYKNKIFITLLKQLSQLDIGIFNGITSSKDYCSAFFYANHKCCTLRDYLKNNITINGYGSGYSVDNEYISGNNNHCNISYDQAVFMASSLSQQICLLEKMGYGFYCFFLDNFYVIDNHIFIYLGIEHITPIVGNISSSSREKNIRFIAPYPEKASIMNQLCDYKTNLFICPEIKLIQKIPCSILYSSTYYHLASIIIYCMFNKNICFHDGEFDGNGDNEMRIHENMIELLSSIKNTKLYWFLIRCIDYEPSKRILLWI